MRKHVPLWIPAISLLIGLVLLYFAGGNYLDTRAWLSESRTAQGTVIDYGVEERHDSDYGYRTYFFPRIRFIDHHGEEIVFESSLGSTSRPYAIGDAVDIRYNADNSFDASVDSFLELWIWVLAIGSFGFVFFGIGALLIVHALLTG
ncbi:DUF3592 domain-containing protein [Candidatus Woesearchaeota archaeon]|nr:DUF3592 domain-containing protein [Candidatus Woesearchaeota archaeon]